MHLLNALDLSPEEACDVILKWVKEKEAVCRCGGGGGGGDEKVEVGDEGTAQGRVQRKGGYGVREGREWSKTHEEKGGA